jgi:hypothetical protein
MANVEPVKVQIPSTVAFLNYKRIWCYESVGVTSYRQNIFWPESGTWEVGLQRFFVRLSDDKGT